MDCPDKEKVLVKIAGPATPCDRCKKTKKNVEEAVAGLEGCDVSIEHISLTDRTTLETYGLLKTPAVIINNVVVSEGDVPTKEQIRRAIKQVLSGRS